MSHLGRHRRAAAAALVLLVAAAASATTTSGTTTSGATASAGSPSVGARAEPRGTVAPSGVGGCAVFPADNYWNTPVDHLAVHRRSADWLSHMSPGSTLHPDFGRSYGEQPVPYGIPITVVAASHPRVPVDFRYRRESDPGPYPLGADTRIEGGRASTGDRHAVVVDSGSCELFETWRTRHRAAGWSAGSGAIWDLGSNRLRPDGWTSADAAGLPILPGLLRYDEVEAGRVSHAIRFTTDETQTAHLWPARHDAGSTSDPAYPPMGARFRLDADFDTTGYRADTVVVLEAMQAYGLVLADNGSPWYFQGTADRRWPSGLLDELKTIPADAFAAVDTGALQVRPDSGAAHQPR